ncbi:MAG TPA: Uma2 family endonuclease [Blastocatellia bacterium]|nr:Uma2 family endonuclease [Blastocatellia bacterium]
MAAPPQIVDRLVVLDNVSWETYERLLAEHQNPGGMRFTYDDGRMQIMVLSLRHEEPNRTLAQLVEVLAEELELDLRRAGSTTFKRADLRKGFEPDSCFYIQNAEAIRGKEQIDLTIDPPPDLIIEIDITSESLKRLPIFAAVGVPEVWRYDGESVTFLQLEDGSYLEADHSLAFYPLTGQMATQFLEESTRLKSTAWLRRVRAWIREQ